jgi:hypothetical protein
MRSGATLAAADVALGLNDAKSSLEPGSEAEAQLIGLVPAIEKARLFRGRGGEVMRGACCRVLEALALTGVALPPERVDAFTKLPPPSSFPFSLSRAR